MTAWHSLHLNMHQDSWEEDMKIERDPDNGIITAKLDGMYDSLIFSGPYMSDFLLKLYKLSIGSTE